MEMARIFTQCLEYEYEPVTPKQIYDYVKHKVMKSQVINRKPRCISKDGVLMWENNALIKLCV